MRSCDHLVSYLCQWFHLACLVSEEYLKGFLRMGVVLTHLCFEEKFLQWVEKGSKELSSSTHNTKECAYKDALHRAQVWGTASKLSYPSML